jgi:SAM-dependent methyltransferase
MALLDKKPRNILDIGSGSGLTLDFFKLKYPKSNFYAIEPSDTAVAMLEKKGIETISRDVDDNWHKSVQKKFDLIIMRHVLEHFSNPVAALKKIESTLTDDGILYIAVPNCSNPIAPLLTHWFRVVHTYYFNKTTLHGILNKSQLQLLKAVEGDDFNRGEMYAFAKKQVKDSDTLIIDRSNFETQLDVYESRLKNERQLLPTFKRKSNLLISELKGLLNKKNA